METHSRGNVPLVLGLLVLAGIFLIGAIFYATAQTALLAGAVGHHYKHAVLAAVLAVLCLIGANFARGSAGAPPR
jgi:hypothetical protein